MLWGKAARIVCGGQLDIVVDPNCPTTIQCRECIYIAGVPSIHWPASSDEIASP